MIESVRRKEKVMLTDINRNEQPIDRLARAEAEWGATVQDLEQQLQSARAILATIRREKAGINGNSQDQTPVIPGQYAGQRAIDALENYLRARKGMRIPLDRCVQDLIIGGADTGQPRGRSADPFRRMRHNLKIAIGNLTDLFAWEPVADTDTGVPRGDVKITIWLKDEPVSPKTKKKS